MTVSKHIFIDISTGKVTSNWDDVSGGTYMPMKSEPSGYSL
jgi:hypothetical protein